MKLSDFKTKLNTVVELNFLLPNGKAIPNHFHVTEVGQITKHFIDCGGKIRDERVVNFQLWEAGDFDHRLAPQKLIGIIQLSEKVLNVQDDEIEVEYQGDTIGKYGLEFDGTNFLLTSKKTDCLASASCGTEKTKITLAELQTSDNVCCTPGGGCC
ncbi:DUF6428 family protein [soil metagenome]